ncbi:MAG: hypothetical protein K8R90_06905 [Candidatus Cloacimonetes bacterium]|nr:hypothetical protein [Candidatus Cloacimonadota bacterium]
MPTFSSPLADTNLFRIRFEYQPLIGGHHEVFLAGEFNGWDPAATPMQSDEGVYSAVLELPAGRYAYKFVVNGLWLVDEGADELAGAGFDGQNAVVVVGDTEAVEALRKIVLRFDPPYEASVVAVAGSFNAWNPTGSPMHRLDDGSWIVDLLLCAGIYEYKFVIDGLNWLPDPQADELIPDGFGGQNATFEVTLDHPRVRLERCDGKILTWGLPIEPDMGMINPLSPTRIELKCRSHVDDVESVDAWVDGARLPLHCYERDNAWEYWRCVVELPEPGAGFRFAFIYHDGDIELFLVRGGFCAEWDEQRLFAYDPKHTEAFLVPEWTRDAIIYQIFPDRFCNGDPSLNQDFSEWYYNDTRTPPTDGKLAYGQVWHHFVGDWYDTDILRENPLHPEGRGDWAAFYGGDLPGIRRKLDYLADLGVNVIYFNPLFEARSTHRYDAADYRRIDPHLGGNEQFRQLVQECHERGIRVILDCAFNHTGDTHMAFVDARERGPSSPFWDWYEFKQWPLPDKDFNPADYYQCWWGHGTMPDLDFDKSHPAWCENGIRDISDANPNWQVVEYILGLADFWLGEMDADGFRLDVPNEVPWWFWELFRRRVKHVKPDAYLVGEIWHQASDWVNRLYFDAVMNYAYFRDPALRFFCLRVCSARTFDRDIKPGRLVYPQQAVQAMMNLLDSHDTHRVIETCQGDIRRLKLVVLFQMTYVGAPHVYYGDEIGMEGGHDPDNRRPFNWRWQQDDAAIDLHRYYRKLIHLRKERKVLSRGEFHTLLTDGRLYAYRRQLGQEKLVVALNNEENPREALLPLAPGIWEDIFNGGEHLADSNGLKLSLAPLSGVILAPAAAKT